MASTLCYSTLYHFTNSFIFHKQLFKTDKSTHNCSRTGETYWLWLILKKTTLLAKHIGLTLSQVKSKVIWTETFWSSLSKDFLSRVFFPWQKLRTGVQTRSSGLFYTWNPRPCLDYTLTAHTHSHTYQAHLLTPSGCTFHLSIGTELNW